MSYIQAYNWERWKRRADNIKNEIIAISKGIDATDIQHSREISELAHMAGATKYLMLAVRELNGALTAAKKEGSNQ